MSDVQADAAPASTEPAAPMTDAEVIASNIPPAAEPAQEPAQEAPPPVDNAHVAEGCEQFAEPAQTADAAHPATGALDRIEAIAVFWGGEVMAELRTLVSTVRGLL